MQVEDPDRQSESARPIDTVRESDNGAALELPTAAQKFSNQDISLGEDSFQMTRSSSEASTSSVLSSDDEKLLDKVAAPEKRVSYYVQVFEEMLDTVLQFESHLFNQEELEMLARFKSMSCMFAESALLLLTVFCGHRS